MGKRISRDLHSHLRDLFTALSDTRKPVQILMAVILAVLIFAVYYQVLNFEWIYFDDPKYVRDNPLVIRGVTGEGIRWAFLSIGYASNWHPMTWLSHMLDVTIFGLNPGMHRLTNVLFHIANTILLFFLLCRMTGEMGKSTVVAALFALHPLHVESVAWISERKDVLSALFFMLTLWVYLRYVQHRGAPRYLLVAAVYALGLMAKPMLVTLPFVLLLLDFWPIKRAELVGPGNTVSDQGVRDTVKKVSWSGFIPLVVEKIPLFILAGASGWITVLAQKKGGALSSLDMIPLGSRVANAVVAYCSYLWKMLWPVDLAVFYPYPGTMDALLVAGSAICLILVTLFVVRFAKTYPFLLVGWLWYVGALVPVIGFVQVGYQSMADRYTYLPLIGIFIMLAWGIPPLVVRLRIGQRTLAAGSAALIVALMVVTSAQVGHWRDSTTLFSHVLKVTQHNYLAHANLSAALLEQNSVENAIFHAQKALKIRPDYVPALNNLGLGLMRQARHQEAVEQFRQALQREPGYVHARVNLGTALYALGRVGEAILEYQRVLQHYPHHENARKVIEHARLKQQEIRDEIVQLQEKLKIKPDDSTILYHLAELYRMNGETQDSIEVYRKALSVNPEMLPAWHALAVLHADRGEYEQALSVLNTMRELKPDDPEIDYNIACIYLRQGRVDEGIHSLNQAINKGFSDVDLLKTDPDLEIIRGTSFYKNLLRQENQ